MGAFHVGPGTLRRLTHACSHHPGQDGVGDHDDDYEDGGVGVDEVVGNDDGDDDDDDDDDDLIDLI